MPNKLLTQKSMAKMLAKDPDWQAAMRRFRIAIIESGKKSTKKKKRKADAARV